MDLFDEINKKCQYFILGGDLNAKSKAFGCYSDDNKNGEILELILEELNICLLNDKSPTFFKAHNNYYEILDLFLCSSNLSDKVLECKVNSKWDMTSDHFPVTLLLSTSYTTSNPIQNNKLDYAKADWNKFKNLLESTPVLENISNVDMICDQISEWIINSAIESIPNKKPLTFKSSLPPLIIKLIKNRRFARRKLKKKKRKHYTT